MLATRAVSTHPEKSVGFEARTCIDFPSFLFVDFFAFLIRFFAQLDCAKPAQVPQTRAVPTPHRDSKGVTGIDKSEYGASLISRVQA
jgi:hypothetical protein